MAVLLHSRAQAEPFLFWVSSTCFEVVKFFHQIVLLKPFLLLFNMVLVSLPTALSTRSLILPRSFILASQASDSLSKNLHLRASVFAKPNSPFQYKAWTSSSPKPKGSSSMSSDDQSSASEEEEEEDDQALETVLKLHAAINENDVNQLSNVIGEECCCICNFFPFFHKSRGKKQVLEFFANLIEKLGNNIEIVVQPTQKDGMSVGIAWRLECSRTHVPLGKGFSLYTCHVYQGKVVIRNVEMFVEPLLHLHPFRLTMAASVASALDRMCCKLKAKRCTCLWLKLFFVISILLFAIHFSIT